MATCLEEFREEIIAGVTCPGAIVEAWTSQQLVSVEETRAMTRALTEEDQMRALFHSVARGEPQMKSSFYHLLQQKVPVLIAQLGKQ